MTHAPETGARNWRQKLASVSGAGFWSVCQGYNGCLNYVCMHVLNVVAAVDSTCHAKNVVQKHALLSFVVQLVIITVCIMVPGQLADCQPTRGLDNSRTSQLADWTTCGLSDAAKRKKTKHAKSPMASASCPVRDLSSMRVV